MRCLAIAVAVCLFAYISGEACPGGNVNECVHTSCDSQTEIHCVDNLCQCTEAGPGSCPGGQVSECNQAWSCPPERRHCIDNQCRCIRIPVGRK